MPDHLFQLKISSEMMERIRHAACSQVTGDPSDSDIVFQAILNFLDAGGVSEGYFEVIGVEPSKEIVVSSLLDGHS